MAAEAASTADAQVDLYDAMASVGRKFLLAGKGGLNSRTRNRPRSFLALRVRRARIAPLLALFGPDALRAWLADSASKHLWALPDACFPPISRRRRCCARGSAGCVKPAYDSRCVIAGPAGTSRGLCLLPRQRETALSEPMRWCLRSAVGVGRSSVLMLRGCRCWQGADFTLRHCSRRTAASTWAGASIFG